MLEVHPSSTEELGWIKSFSCQILNERLGVKRPVQVLCQRSLARKLKRAARQKQIVYRFISKHFGVEVATQEMEMRKLGDTTRLKSQRRRKMGFRRKFKILGRRKDQRHSTFLDVKLMYEWYEDIGTKYDFVTMETIGETLEGRQIKIVKINSENVDLPVIFIDAGIHAREWISPAAVMFFVHKMVKMIAKGKGEGNLASFQWHIVPLANPDGYQYSIDKDRMWRKNRQSNKGSKCEGVDLNRNFQLAYGTASSSNPCQEDFRGANAFSEKESVTIRDYLKTMEDKRKHV